MIKTPWINKIEWIFFLDFEAIHSIVLQIYKSYFAFWFSPIGDRRI